jgi:hypothetical protein
MGRDGDQSGSGENGSPLQLSAGWDPAVQHERISELLPLAGRHPPPRGVTVESRARELCPAHDHFLRFGDVVEAFEVLAR